MQEQGQAVVTFKWSNKDSKSCYAFKAKYALENWSENWVFETYIMVGPP